jgi:hypothetical protein
MCPIFLLEYRIVDNSRQLPETFCPTGKRLTVPVGIDPTSPELAETHVNSAQGAVPKPDSILYKSYKIIKRANYGKIIICQSQKIAICILR